ncbi:PIH1D1/2/3 [Trypanosoma melophagium]|uniref:PIH1D1/2/3 n=1 Tax=Trypanosoma melophagium TaxID=715481 RepID=UPI00351A889E|nr:PIH1D1/2/3 [Trypanosoma melophagium]
MNGTDISSLVELLDKNKGFKRPDGQTIGYSLQEVDSREIPSSCVTNTVQANPISVTLPPMVVDQQLGLPIPSDTREAKKLQMKKRQVLIPKGYAIWTKEEIAAAVSSHNDAARKPLEGAEEPEYTILYQENITAEDVYLGIDVNKSDSSSLLVKIVMPKQDKITDIAIEVDSFEFYLSSSKYYLRAALPKKVISGKADAKWESNTKTLSVRLLVDDSERFI